MDWLEKEPPQEKNALILEGCKKHYEADGWFHESVYFKHSCQLLEKEMETERETRSLFQNQRIWFLAHILSELLLDRLILEKHPDAVNHFYRDLHQVPFTDIETFLLKSGKTAMGNFSIGHERFISSEFVRHYIQNEGIIEALDRVVQRTGQIAFTKNERLFLIGRIPAWLKLAEGVEKPVEMGRM